MTQRELVIKCLQDASPTYLSTNSIKRRTHLRKNDVYAVLEDMVKNGEAVRNGVSYQLREDS